MGGMPASIPELYDEFLVGLGRVNSRWCALDVALKELERARGAEAAEAFYKRVGTPHGHSLNFGDAPDLESPLGREGVVFLHKCLEDFSAMVRRFAHERGLVKHEWSNPLRGEDHLRAAVRNIRLMHAGASSVPDYKNEPKADAELRERQFKDVVGDLNCDLLDYYRRVRHRAVHHERDYQDELDQSFENLRHEHVQKLCASRYGVGPSSPGDVSMEDFLLYSKVVQASCWRIVLELRPSIEDEVVPYLLRKFARFASRDRRRNAVVGELRTRYGLSTDEAARIVGYLDTAD